MTISRLYIMHAAEGKDAQLETALRGVVEIIRAVPGNEGVELLRDLGNERRFIFIEKWDSVESHGKAASHLPEGTLDPIGAALDGPPDGAYFDYLKTA